ncbi:hypothetical protein SBA3_3850002 [Candidatus Sulfopaludibacter sp. SbA3]|nr:hypothetical protein SBA3_3850002 [Candidatus Sulfopaludibacter sp. SbA3]
MVRGAHALWMLTAHVAAVDQQAASDLMAFRVRARVRVAGKPEVIQLDERSTRTMALPGHPESGPPWNHRSCAVAKGRLIRDHGRHQPIDRPYAVDRD